VTRGEIRLVIFLVLALLTGAVVKWWREREARNLPPPSAAAPPPGGWAKPPYVFKTTKEAREAHQRAERAP
jgi:hypothetical protein